MSTPAQDTFEAETGLQPTKVAMPANTAREGVDVSDSTATPRDAAIAAKPFAGDSSPIQTTTNTIEHHATPVAATTAHQEEGVTAITTGLGGMLVTGPLAALEKVSPALAHGVENVASAVADGFHSLTGTGAQYHSTIPIDAAQLPDAAQVKSAANTAAQQFNDNVKPALVSGAQQVHQTVTPAVVHGAQRVNATIQPALASTAEQVQQSLPQTVGGQAPPATQQLAQVLSLAKSTVNEAADGLVNPHAQPTTATTTTTRETGSIAGIEPAGVRKQVHPVGAGGNPAVPHTATASTADAPAPLITGGDVHGYVDLVKEKVREAGEMLSHVLPGPEKQQQISETAAKSLERVPDIASSAAQTTATGLTAAAQTTAAYAAPAANYTASAATSAAQQTAGLATSAAHSVAEAAQRAAAQAHLPGWKAPTNEGVHTGEAVETTSTGPGFASPMGESKAPGDEAQVVKDLLRGDTAGTGHGAVEEHYKHETRDRALPALTQEADASTRGKDEGKGFDLSRTHNEAALDQQVSTHNPDASLSKKNDEPAVARQAATLSHRDSDFSQPSTPGTATILSHQTLGGPSSSSPSAADFGTGSSTTSQQHSLGSANPYAQLVGQNPYHGEGAVESAGFKSFEPTAPQSAGGKDRHAEGQTSSFMPHSSGVGHSSSSTHPRSPGREDTHTPSHVDTSHHDGAPSVYGAGSPHTYSSTHGGESASRSGGALGGGSLAGGNLGAGSPQTYSSTNESSNFGATSGSETHPAFTKDSADFGSSTTGSGAHQQDTFSTFGTGQPRALGASHVGGTAPGVTGAHSSSSATTGQRGEYSTSAERGDYSTASSAAQQGGYSSSSTSAKHDDHSSPLTRHDEHLSSAAAKRDDHSTSTGTGEHAFTTLDELEAKKGSSTHGSSTHGAGQSSTTSKLETAASKLDPTSSSRPHDSSTSKDFGSSSSASHGLGSSSSATGTHDSTSRSGLGVGAGAPDSSPAGKAERAAHDATSSSTPASRTGAHDSSLADKAERAAHESTTSSSTGATGAAGSASHGTTGSATHGASESHKPSLKERIKETLHHVAH
ncbi:hypothetical protein JCM10450v2_004000 [Rhodotorula kratochvilovae]